MLYPSFTLVQFHNCICCPLINYPEDSGNPPYKFHLESAAESQPSSKAKLSSSSSVAKSQSSCCSLTSSVAKSQLSAWYNGCSDDNSNPHSPGLDNWQSDRSSNQMDSYINGSSNDMSNPHSPGLNSWQSNGTNSEGKGSISGIYNLETNDDQVPKGSNGGSSSSKGLAFQGLSGLFRKSWGSFGTTIGKHWLQAPPRRLPHGAQLLNLPSNVKMGHWANKPPR